jgi:hypothetical protein
MSSLRKFLIAAILAQKTFCGAETSKSAGTEWTGAGIGGNVN